MDINEKPLGLIILDLMFMIMPEIEIFGETVRDLLNCEHISILNFQIGGLDINILKTYFEKLKDNIEIHGYILRMENIEDYKDTWNNFEEIFMRTGMTAGIIQKISGNLDQNMSQIRILMISSDKIDKYYPIYTCNMLKMNSDGQIGVLEENKLENNKRLETEKISQIREVLYDIYNHKISPINRPIEKSEGGGYLDRLRRSEMIFILVELMERNWIPTFNIADCGLNISIYKLGGYHETFEYPKLPEIYKKMITFDKNKDKIENNPENNPDNNPENHPDNNPDNKPENHPDNKLEKNPENKPENHSENKAENHIENKIENRENKEQEEESERVEDICAICYDKLDNGSSIIRINCGHLYHNFCIFQHFHKVGSNSDSCPICRYNVIRK
jgi:hypothetical protein